jgi:hypothetical protein
VRLLAGPRGGQRPRARHVVVHEDAVQRAVDAVVDPVLTALAARALPDDARGERESFLGEVPPGLADDLQAWQVAEVLRERVVDDRRRLVEGGTGREPAADVEDAHGRHAEGVGRVERRARGLDGTAVHVNAGRTGPDVEGDARDVEPRALGGAQQRHHLVGERTVLDPQVDLGLATIGALEAEQELAVGVAALDLGHLLGGVVGGKVDADLRSVLEVWLGLAGVGVDDAAWLDAEREHGLDLGAAGAVEARAERGQRADERLLGVALDGVVGAHAGERAAPGPEEVDDLGEVEDVEAALRWAGLDVATMERIRPETVSFSLSASRLKERTFLSLTPGPNSTACMGLPPSMMPANADRRI